MAIVLPGEHGEAFLLALRDAARTARDIRDQSGDLTFAQLNLLLQHVARIRSAYPRVRADAQANEAAVSSFIASAGGPATWAQVETRIGAASTALNAFMTMLRTGLRNMTGPELIDLVQRDFGGISSEQIQVASFVPATKANALRGSTQLASLIAAFEALGATA